MMYPFLVLDDKTEIVHSETLSDGRVRVYCEKPVHGDLLSASCFLPDYQWQDVDGFTPEEIAYLESVVRNSAHLILRFAKEGGFENASGL